MPDHLPASRLRPIHLPDPAATDRLGAALARLLDPGDTVLLSGPLGAGKSHLARAIIRAALATAGRPQEDIPSPTYTLVQSYDLGTHDILHADLYRLSGSEDAIELGLTDAFGRDLCLVEWPERLGALTPDGALAILLEPEGEGRRVVLSGAERWPERRNAGLAGLAAAMATERSG